MTCERVDWGVKGGTKSPSLFGMEEGREVVPVPLPESIRNYCFVKQLVSIISKYLNT